MHRSGRLRLPFGIAVIALVLLAGHAPGDPVPFGKPHEELRAEEVKALVALMRTAVKEECRRQAWYLADRIKALDAKHAEALDVLARWTPEDLQQGTAPDKAFAAKRDAALGKIGAQYAALARTLTGQGKAPTSFWFLIERALAYGNRDSDVVASLNDSSSVWAGTFGSQNDDAGWKETVGAIGQAASFPPEWDDDWLKIRAWWPEAKCARVNGWRFETSVPAADAWKAIGRLAALEAHVVSAFGSLHKEARRESDDPPMDLLWIPDPVVYDRIGTIPNMRPEDKKAFEGSSGYQDRWNRRLLVLTKPRTDEWIGGDALLQGFASRILVRRHMGPMTGWLTGRGSWILDGMQGAYEGFAPSGVTGGDLDPSRCWRLAAAKVLKDGKALLPWEQLLELDRRQADDVSRVKLRFRFGGADRDVEKLDAVAAQATALVLGIWRADGGKGAKKLAALLQETLKRDRMPDLDKTLGWPKGRAIREAEALLDATEFK